MSENKTPQFAVHNIYTKDISYEAPNTPQIFQFQDWQPNVDFDMQMGHADLGGNVYEVGLNLTVTVKLNVNQEAKSKEEEKLETAFLVEIVQGGIFQAEGFEQDQLEYVLSVEAPSILFPYARETVSTLVTKGGFPQLVLPPMNFDAMYQNHLQEKQQSPAKEPAPAAND